MPAKTTQKTTEPTAPPLPIVKGKLGEMVKLMRRKQGASITQLIEATGWQEHSVRGALAGALKKRGLTITSEKEGDVRIYRVDAAPIPPAEDVASVPAPAPDSASAHP